MDTMFDHWKNCDVERMIKHHVGKDYEQMISSNDVQIGGNHYRYERIKIQPWDYIAANNLDFFQGNIIKYVTRWNLKGGLEDLLKAKHVLEKYIEVNQCESKKTEA